MATYDPFTILPFHGYVNGETGERELHYSLAHFYHHQRLAGSSEVIKQYLTSIDDPDLFRIEVEGVGYDTTAEAWQENEIACLKAGLYMQAIEHNEVYTEIIQTVSDLSVVNCDFATPLAESLSSFIGGLSDNKEALKVAFMGEAPASFVKDCFKVIFGKRLPDTLFALEGEAMAVIISDLARQLYVPLSMIAGDLEIATAAQSMSRRCTHFFNFISDKSASRSLAIAEALTATGNTVTPISADHAKAG